MSILTCLEGKLQGKLMKDVREIHDSQMERFGGDVTRADAETIRIIEASSETVKRAKQHAALTIVDQEKEINAALALENSFYNALSPFSKRARKLTRQVPSYVRTYTDQILNKVDFTAQARSKIALREMPAVMELLRKRPARSDPEAWRDFVRGLKDGPEVVNDLEVRKAVNEYRKYIDGSEENLKAAGLHVGHVPNYIPIRHDFATIGRASEADWKQMMNETTDLGSVYNQRQHRVGVEAEDFDRITSAMYRRAKFGDQEMAARRIKAESGSGITSSARVTDLWGKHASNRIFHPIDAESYLRYVDNYGGGTESLDKLFLSHVNAVERDIATAQIMGPLPSNVNQRMLNRAEEAGAGKGQLAFADGMYKTSQNQWEGSIDTSLVQGWQTFQNYLSLNLLGSAPISAIGDQALVGNLRRLMGFTDGNGKLSSFFATSKLTRDDALRGSALAELMARNTVGRYDALQEDALLGGIAEKSAKVRDLSHRFVGLNAMTEMASNQMTMIMFSSISEKIAKQSGWADQTMEFKRLLGKVGMGESDWAKVLKFDIDNVPDNFISPNRMQGTDPDLALKLEALDVAIRQTAVNAPDLFTRNLSSGRFAGPRSHGDMTHLVMSSLMQFKSFPVQVWRNHFMPALMRLTDTGNPLPLGIAMLEATFFGTIALQLNALASGKAPYDAEHMATRGFAVDAFVKGGFGGLLGDIMLQDPNAYKASILSRLAGPTASTTESVFLGIASQAVAQMDGDPETGWDQSKAVQTFKSLIPLKSHWYAKAGIEHTLIDTLNSLDPDYYQTLDRRRDLSIEQRGSGSLEEYMAR